MTESAVVPASLIRHELKLFRNSKSVINRCTDKLKMKEYLFEKNIPMTNFLSSRNKSVDQIMSQLGLPLVCKVKHSSGGRGVTFINSREELERNLSKDVYFESVVNGKEGSIESFIQNREIIFTNITEYYKNGECNLVPCTYSDELKSKLLELNEKVINALNIKWGMTHLEFYITEDKILFGEVALRPPGGYIMDSLDLSYSQKFWDIFIDIELHQNVEINNINQNFSCSIIIHPGKGIVKTISGEDAINKLESLVNFKLKVNEGDKILNREGVGQECGHLILSSKIKENLLDDLSKFYANFKIHLS